MSAIVTPTATPTGARPVALTPTPTPTPVILATELAPPSPSATATAQKSDVAWQGTIHTDTTGGYGSAGSCTESWDSQFTLAVAGDGTVSGKGQGQLVSPPKCTGTVKPQNQASSVEFTLSGTSDSTRFRLQFVETKIDGATMGLLNYALFLPPDSPPAIVVPVTGVGTAQGVVDVSQSVPFSVGGSVTAHHTVSMRCTTCK